MHDARFELAKKHICYSHPKYKAKTLTGKRHSRLTIAYCVAGNTMWFGIAVCSDDDQFVKADGRDIATSRLTRLNQKISLNIMPPTRREQLEIIFEYLRFAIRTDITIAGVPSTWTKVRIKPLRSNSFNYD